MFRSTVTAAAVSIFSLACATSGSRVEPGVERFLFVEGKAGRLWVEGRGTGGIPVVFVHELGGDLEAWRAQLDHFRPGRRAIAYDICQQSEQPLGHNLLMIAPIIHSPASPSG